MAVFRWFCLRCRRLHSGACARRECASQLCVWWSCFRVTCWPEAIASWAASPLVEAGGRGGRGRGGGAGNVLDAAEPAVRMRRNRPLCRLIDRFCFFCGGCMFTFSPRKELSDVHLFSVTCTPCRPSQWFYLCRWLGVSTATFDGSNWHTSWC